MATQISTLPVYRFCNIDTGAHFYTIFEEEKNSIIKNLPQFRYEGIAFHAFIDPVTISTPDPSPTPTPDPTPTPGPTPGSDIFASAIALEFNNPSNTLKISLSPGNKVAFKFTAPTGLTNISVDVSSFEQVAPIDMIVMTGTGTPKDYYDQVRQWYSDNNTWGYDHDVQIDGYQIWARMSNNPEGNGFAIFEPPAGVYWMIVKNESKSDMSTINARAMGR